MIPAILIAVELITLHQVDGRVVQVNPQQVTDLIHARPGHRNKSLAETVNCVIHLTDGRFLSVAESCEEVQRAMEGKTP